MPQAYLPQQRDTRTFGAMQTRLINDLNRPDLGDVVIDYLRDAIKFWARKPFFFTEIDNRDTPQWQPNTVYPLGSTIHQSIQTTWDPFPIEYAFVAMSRGMPQSGGDPPTWTDEEFLVWPGSWYYQPPEPDWDGVVVDNEVTWANIGFYQPGYHTQLSTVPNVNRYDPPIDYVSPYMVQMTTANLRLILDRLPFEVLSSYDVVQPAPIAAYPRFWSWWGNQLYFWVYPNGFYPITLSYNCAPLMPVKSSDSNYWTTEAERLIRKSAQAAINREVLYDAEATQFATLAATQELVQLKGQAISQNGYFIPPTGW